MPISPKASQNIQFLNDLDVAKFSIGQDGDHLKQVNKRSQLCNFFHWVIHVITFTLVPQNRELDRITSHILKEIQDELKEATNGERHLAEKAIRNLRIVIKNNGGSQNDAIEKMLSTLAKIESLPMVQNLSGKNNEQEGDLLEEEIFDDSLEAEVPCDTNKTQSELPPDTKETKSDAPSDTKKTQSNDLLEEEIPEDSLEAKGPTDTKETQPEVSTNTKETASDTPSDTKETQPEVPHDTKESQSDDLLEEDIHEDLSEAEVPTDTEETQPEAPSDTKELQSDDLLEEEIPEDLFEVEAPSDAEETQSEAPPISINFQEKRLQDLLQDLSNRKADNDKAKNSIATLLPELKGSVPLSNDQLTVLGKAFAGMYHDLKKDLSPGLLACIVRDSLKNANLIYLRPILHVMSDRGPFEKERFVAFAYGFKLYRNTLKANMPTQEIAPTQMHFLFSIGLLDGKTSFKNYLSEDEMKDFVQDFFELVVAQTSDDSQEKIANFKTATILINKFGNQYVQIALKTLCQVKNVKLLTQICRWENASHFVIETILNSNPPKEDDPDDTFFQEFVDELMKEIEKLMKEIADLNNSRERYSKKFDLRYEENYVNKIAEYVFANECAERQEMLANKLSLSPGLIVLQLKHIPVQAWQDINDSSLLEVAEKLISQNPTPTNPALKAFAKGLNADRLYNLIAQNHVDYRDFCGSLLPLCEFSTQVQFVNKVLDSRSYDHRECLYKIQSKLDSKVWEEASKQNPSRNYKDIKDCYSPKVLAHIVNGQINNQQFLRDFFESYFDKHWGDVEKQKTCVAHLEPEVFEFDKPEDIQHQTWYKFFKVLREIPNRTHAQNLLIRSTLRLFNSPGFCGVQEKYIYTLTREQMMLLPIQQYKKPEIRLLLACLTNRLDDALLDTANSLYDQKGGEFFKFFESAHLKSYDTRVHLEEMYSFVFENDIRFLKYFLTWVLNRPSIDPVLPTWRWINENYQGQVILASREIQYDSSFTSDIMKHIKRLNLSVNKPKR